MKLFAAALRVRKDPGWLPTLPLTSRSNVVTIWNRCDFGTICRFDLIQECLDPWVVKTTLGLRAQQTLVQRLLWCRRRAEES